MRVIFDSELRLQPTSVLARTAHDVPTLVVTTRRAPTHARRALQALGVEILMVEANASRRLDLPAALRALGERGLTRLCSEGGPRLADALAQADLIDLCTLITGSTELGASGGLPAVGQNLARRLEDFSVAETLDLGPDRAVTYERRR